MKFRHAEQRAAKIDAELANPGSTNALIDDRRGNSGTWLRRCTTCYEWKILEADFHWREKDRGIRLHVCKVCNNARQLIWADGNRDARREGWRRYRKKNYLKNTYGITEEEYWRLYAEQGECCAICDRPGAQMGRDDQAYPLHVDHDHETGWVRSLLCQICNTALGQLQDDYELIIKAALYLESWSHLKSAPAREGAPKVRKSKAKYLKRTIESDEK